MVAVASKDLPLHIVSADGAAIRFDIPMAKPCRPPAIVAKLKVDGLLVDTNLERALTGPVPAQMSVEVPIPVSDGTLFTPGGVIVS